MSWTPNGYVWTEEEEDALLKGVGKYGLDFERIRGDNGKVLAYRNPSALKQHLYRKYPAKLKELRAVTPWKGNHVAWTAEQDAALKRGIKEYGKDWDEIHKSENKVLGRRTLGTLQLRYYRHLK
ncbi:hypothetical protein TrST_g13188 [Triparma strigata]|uniref:Myb-like domain-containing protein n=1 Tax=Triparma strigata TaxID=1606541 RepID=A0A9W7BYV5_9STRA|nr:hypothetical protein TrST_g13188 [Triparma strigata]